MADRLSTSPRPPRVLGAPPATSAGLPHRAGRWRRALRRRHGGCARRHLRHRLRPRRCALVTFAEHFDHLALIAPPEATSGNHVLVGSDAPIELDRIDPAAGIAITGEELEAFLGDAQALRDDFAPVDQLISRR